MTIADEHSNTLVKCFIHLGLMFGCIVSSSHTAVAAPAKAPPGDERPGSEQRLCTRVLESQMFARTELLFGLSRTGAPDVTELEFKQFIDSKVTPRFPEGLTLLSGNGQFKDAAGNIVKEGSKLLILLYPFSIPSSKLVDEIRHDYKERFRQESVLRIDDVSCVSF